MNTVVVSVLLTICLMMSCIHQSEAINCYECTGVSTDSSSPCLPPVDTTKTCGNALNITDLINCITVVSGCESCSITKSSALGITTYVRSCALAGSTVLANKCITTNSVQTCYSSCSTNLCNTGSDAPGLRFALLHVIATLCLSTAASALFWLLTRCRS